MPYDPTLSQRRILVTGAGSGIGRSFLDAALSDGASVFATARDQAEQASLSAVLPHGRIAIVDLGDPAAAESVAESAEAALGGLDGLVYSAGVFDLRGALETALGQWEAVINVNLNSAFQIARGCAALMTPARRGSIVMLSSQIGLIGHPRAAAYTASKSAINGLVRAMALELSPHGIRVNGVGPGPISTPMTSVARADETRNEKLLASIPLGRFGEAAEVAAVIRFLLSDAASFVTGQILYADGGVTAS